MSKQFIIPIIQSAGLGNRIHVLINGMRITDELFDTNNGYTIRWHSKRSDISINDLFDLTNENIKIIDQIEVNDNYVIPRRKPSYIKQQKLRYVLDKNTELSLLCCCNNGFVIMEDELKYLDGILTLDGRPHNLSYLYDRTPDIFKQIYLKYFEILKPSQKINTIVDEFMQKYFKKYTVGIHLRLGDKIVSQTRKAQYCKQFYQYIEGEIEKNNDVIFFVSCDEEFGYERMKIRYNDKIINYDHNYDEQQSDDITSFVCMLLLSKCDKLICGYGSTFSECAWWYGGCKDITVVI